MKYALLVGISYTGTKLSLPGCQNDIISMKNILNKWGFKNENITIVSDKGNIAPTAFNLNTTLNNFTRKLMLGDKAFIYYTGHGMRVNNESCLVPIDHKKAGVINSETIRYYLNKISAGVNVFCIFDCCNSGTICDLKYHHFDTSYKNDVTVKLKFYNPSDWKLRQHKTIVTEITKKLNISINPDFILEDDTMDFTKTSNKSDSLDTNANIISFSGCWDDQVSYDLGKNGALTMSFLNTISRYGISELKIKDILQHTRGFIYNMRLPQTPQLMCGKNINIEVLFRDFLNINL
jgi:hypothetical protein